MVAAAPIVDAAGVECLSIGSVVTTMILSLSAVAAVGSRSTSKRLVLGVAELSASRDMGGLNDGCAEQENPEQNQRPVHGADLIGLRCHWLKVEGVVFVTFHREFHMVRDPFQSLEGFIEIGGTQRILTSGCERSAYEGLDMLVEHSKRANGRIIINPGAACWKGMDYLYFDN
ncbi:hypothetical protein EDD21DRAFT_416148 [Dissophora ornata]|nr:hypothetical protein EDD21DRAFT_416148 [Dissophora ornata]